MIRFFAIAVALALIGYPLFLIHGITVPVARFRTGGYVLRGLTALTATDGSFPGSYDHRLL